MLPAGWGIAFTVIGEKQIAQRLPEVAQELSVPLTFWRRQTVTQAPGARLLERIQLVWTAWEFDRVHETPDQLQAAGGCVGDRAHRARHAGSIFTGKNA